MVVVVRSPVEAEARTLEVGEVHSLEAGIVVVVDSYVAAPGRERRTCRRRIRRAGRLFQFLQGQLWRLEPVGTRNKREVFRR